jgi:hypothetical protein
VKPSGNTNRLRDVVAPRIRIGSAPSAPKPFANGLPLPAARSIHHSMGLHSRRSAAGVPLRRGSRRPVKARHALAKDEEQAPERELVALLLARASRSRACQARTASNA